MGRKQNAAPIWSGIRLFNCFVPPNLHVYGRVVMVLVPMFLPVYGIQQVYGLRISTNFTLPALLRGVITINGLRPFVAGRRTRA